MKWKGLSINPYRCPKYLQCALNKSFHVKGQLLLLERFPNSLSDKNKEGCIRKLCTLFPSWQLSSGSILFGRCYIQSVLIKGCLKIQNIFTTTSAINSSDTLVAWSTRTFSSPSALPLLQHSQKAFPAPAQVCSQQRPSLLGPCALPPAQPQPHSEKSCAHVPAWLPQGVGCTGRLLHLILRVKSMPKGPKQRKSRSSERGLVIIQPGYLAQEDLMRNKIPRLDHKRKMKSLPFYEKDWFHRHHFRNLLFVQLCHVCAWQRAGSSGVW